MDLLGNFQLAFFYSALIVYFVIRNHIQDWQITTMALSMPTGLSQFINAIKTLIEKNDMTEIDQLSARLRPYRIETHEAIVSGKTLLKSVLILEEEQPSQWVLLLTVWTTSLMMQCACTDVTHLFRSLSSTWVWDWPRPYMWPRLPVATSIQQI